MRIILCDNDQITKLDLPANVEGSFFLNVPNQEPSLVAINSENGKWYMISNADVVITYNNQPASKIEVVSHCLYGLKAQGKNYLVYVEDSYDSSICAYKMLDSTITIAYQNADITYNFKYIGPQSFKIIHNENGYNLSIIKDALLFKNGFHLKESTTVLHNGDTIFFYGLKIMVCNNLIIMNNPLGKVSVSNKLQLIDLPYQKYTPAATDKNDHVNLYDEKDYFYKTPRIRRYIKTYDMSVALPPAKVEEEIAQKIQENLAILY